MSAHKGHDDMHTAYLILHAALEVQKSAGDKLSQKKALIQFCNEHRYNFRMLFGMLKKYPKLQRMILTSMTSQMLNHQLLLKHFDVASFSSTTISHSGEKQHSYITPSGLAAVLKGNSSLQDAPPPRVMFMAVHASFKSNTGYELCFPLAL